ncbi:acyl-CoA carboxylase subunit epsilon [Herbidospora sp. NEAU-GS84]|uniref:Acyl-CoA carboxylase subunit epsilon n=1 Tax=Herbidospora solisilvae TaxID=2696284 RepID=A0A7C9N924_9ACTN|nr:MULTISPECIES: acyl-CoA carboxylase subunit epsilon [Herbidospora]NAS24553.1 acyl-CoA carboxylase subunit epsilon [Herbidospora solisilvae]
MTHLRIVRGDATPEEVAALVVALRHISLTEPEREPSPPRWRAPSRRMRGNVPPRPGKGTWRASGLPE